MHKLRYFFSAILTILTLILSPVLLAEAICGDPKQVDLIYGGQATKAGVVDIAVKPVGEQLFLSLKATTQDGWQITSAKIHWGKDLRDFPLNKQNLPTPGKFLLKRDYVAPITEFLDESLSLQSMAPAYGLILIALQFELQKEVNGVLVKEGAWAQEILFAEGKNNSMYLNYCVAPPKPKVGRLEFRNETGKIDALTLNQSKTGTITVFNSGDGNISNLALTIPAALSEQLQNNCGTTLVSQASCIINYNMPLFPAYGNYTLTAAGTNADNGPLDLPLLVQLNGRAVCWGINTRGQLGNNTTVNSDISGQVQGLEQDVQDITGGESHACALLDTGAVQCWGYNTSGQLGNGTITPNSLIPVQVKIKGVQAITAGNSHTCALLDNGSVQCWGANGLGQLGNATLASSSIPLQVSGLTQGVKAITAGDSYTCALLDSGSVQCWGLNNFGQLGNGTLLNSSIPVQVSGLTQVVKAITGGNSYTCALLDSGSVQCWGLNNFGQLGNGSFFSSSIPVQVSDLTQGVQDIAGGGRHACALLDSGAVQCWGDNLTAQLGNGTLTSSRIPVQVSGLTEGVKAITGGNFHNCALLDSGAVQCWGMYGVQPTLGILTQYTATMIKTPVPMPGLQDGVAAIFNHNQGLRFNCAIVNY